MDHRIEVFFYEIKLSYVGKRSGIILFLYEKDIYGIGEVAPLPGISRESIKDALDQIIQIKEGKTVKRPFPSVKFGIELAKLSLEAKKKGCSVVDLIKEGSLKKRIKTRALVGRFNLSDLERIIEGYSFFKVKIRDKKDEGIVREVSKKGKVAVDAEKLFLLEDAIGFVERIKDVQLDYIEDPLRRKEEIFEFFRRTNIKVAIDRDILDENIRKAEPVKAWIIKPGIVGGISDCISLIKEAKKRGIYPVISNPFYSGIGTSALIQLSAIIEEDIPMGLDPYSWIKEDILEERFLIEDGEFILEDVIKKSERIKKGRIFPVR